MFTDKQRETLIELGFTIGYDLVGEVAYQENAYSSNDTYTVICPDGNVYAVESSNIVASLGTY